MKLVAMHTSTNSPGRVDATAVFIPYSKGICDHYSKHGWEVANHGIACSTSQGNRRKAVMAALTEHQAIDVYAYFGHGLSGAIQHGFGPLSIDKLAGALKERGVKHVALYACLAAKDPVDGFGIKLAKLTGARVMGHTVSGHAVWNPMVRWLYPDGTYRWVVEPKSKMWEAWRKLLRDTDAKYELATLPEEKLPALIGSP